MSLWRTTDSRVAYQNKWIRVVEETFERPDGTTGLYGVVKTKGGVGVVASDSAGRIVLVAQYRYPASVNSLEIPKGAFDQFNGTESAVEAAQRELKEETGIAAGNWLELATVHTLLGYSDDTVHLFAANDIVEGERNLDDEERIEVVRLTFEEAVRAINDEIVIQGIEYRITDATTISALFMARNANMV
ncbi:NUDIX hydrolase [Stappia sp. F7233]|uniref:GDP-mannose pyrophosphatase n=1 Tax=Stappia albiluteola TaxID=2758565 RepID=A0A839A9D4_9HYPH|nr:NUDIX hydrolase [Stappia albiluteola]MBA5775668.1 NUDIX hydrolase [Stappia albiluteola]